MFFTFFTFFTMPSLGVYFSDEEATAVDAAAVVSPEKKPSPYIAEAVRQRLSREGMLPGNPRAEINAAIEEVGVDRALEALRKEKRRLEREAVPAR
jgi:predicted hydrolase (HD superfamily)